MTPVGASGVGLLLRSLTPFLAYLLNARRALRSSRSPRSSRGEDGALRAPLDELFAGSPRSSRGEDGALRAPLDELFARLGSPRSSRGEDGALRAPPFGLRRGPPELREGGRAPRSTCSLLTGREVLRQAGAGGDSRRTSSALPHARAHVRQREAYSRIGIHESFVSSGFAAGGRCPGL